MNTLFYFFIAGTVITMIWAAFLFFNWEIPKTVVEFRSLSQMLKDSEEGASKKTRSTHQLIHTGSTGEQKLRSSQFPAEVKRLKTDDALEDNPVTPVVQGKEDSPGTAFLSQVEAGSATEYLAEKERLAFTELLSSQSDIDAVKEKETEYLNQKPNLSFTEFLSDDQQGDGGVYTEYLQEENQGAVTELLDTDDTGWEDSAAERASPYDTQILTEMTTIEKEGTEKT